MTAMDRRNSLGHGLINAFLTTARRDKATAIAAADVALEMMAPTLPEAAPVFGAAQHDADWWAEFASDTMVVAMLSACLKRLTRLPIIAPNARKRAIVAIWNTLDEKDRTAFLQMVDPGPGAKE